MIALAALLAIGVGLALGLTGGGGSILTVPILVYLLGVDPKEAIATSLVVVGVTSAVAVVPYARAGQVAWRTGLTFGAAGMVGAYIGGTLAAFVDGHTLLVLFALLMAATGMAMLWHRREPEPGATRSHPAWRVVADGLVVGAVTGLVGAGGGFLVVPALVLLGGLPMRQAVGTSLIVLALKSFAGWLGHAGHAAIDPILTTTFASAAVVGSLAGSRLAPRIPAAVLRRGFGAVVLAVAAVQFVHETQGGTTLSIDLQLLRPLAGGALVGLAGSLLLLGAGRVSGVSGIFGGLFQGAGDRAWRASFVGGLVLAGAVAAVVAPDALAYDADRPRWAIGLAGLLVGLGTRIGNGCTSGHGVCGLSRLSGRSLVATVVFMSTGALTVWLVGHLLGGAR